MRPPKAGIQASRKNRSAPEAAVKPRKMYTKASTKDRLHPLNQQGSLPKEGTPYIPPPPKSSRTSLLYKNPLLPQKETPFLEAAA